MIVITALGRGTPQAENAGYITASFKMDDLLVDTGARLREVINPSFMDNIVNQADAVMNKGLFFGPIDGDRKMPSCATRDIAAALLLDKSWTGRGHAAVLGPEDLSFNDMARILSDVLGKDVRYQ